MSHGNTGINAISVAPHIKSGDSTRRIMWTVILSLLPAVIYSGYIFGRHQFLSYAVSIASAAAVETVSQLVTGRKIRIMDGSAVITGILLAMNLPPSLPLWMPAAGSAFSVLVAKQIFGGLGLNLFNPALAGRAFLLLAWHAQLRTGWYVGQAGNIAAEKLTYYAVLPQQSLDIVSGAWQAGTVYSAPGSCPGYTASLQSMYDFFINGKILKSLFIGNAGGYSGEISVLLVIAGGLFLMWRKIISWHIPLSFIAALTLSFYFYYHYRGMPYPGFLTFIHLMSGGVMLAVFYMATDPVTSPLTAKGMIIFGFSCGLLVFAVRIAGFYPEGPTMAILLMNAFVPFIDRITRPAVFGLK